MDWNSNDQHHMARALSLAARGRGLVEPNPMVGCVLVKECGTAAPGCVEGGRVVAEGFHRRFGGPHAEVEALRRAGRRAEGATAYITLEPCCHIGKTPPCTDALIAAGVRRVVAAMKDPNPLVGGKGLSALRKQGIRCEVGLLEDQARTLNAPFVTFITKGRPYVILKWAQSLDGKIATRTGDSKWITSAESRAAAHALRARVDGILVGVNTVLADDPDLTCRHAPPLRIATRIVLDSHLRTPLSAKVVRTAKKIPTIVATARSSVGGRKWGALEKAGCEVVEIPTGRPGYAQGLRRGESRIRLRPLMRVLRDRGMTNILVEGGGQVLGDFVQQGLADEARVFIAPKLIGGESAPGPLRNIGPASMTALPHVEWVDTLHIGPEMCYTVRFK